MNRDGAHIGFLFLSGNGQHVLVLQRYICDCTIQDSFYINRNHTPSTVCFHAMEHSMCRKSILCDTISLFNQGLYSCHTIANMISSRSEYSTYNLNHVLISRLNRTHCHRVSVSHTETVHIELINVIDRIFITGSTIHTDRLLISISRKASRIFNQRGDTLILFHLIGHRAFYITRDIYDTVVWTNHNDIIIGQTNV